MFVNKYNERARDSLACCVYGITRGEKGKGTIGQTGNRKFSSGADGGEAMDISKITGDCSGDRRYDFCASGSGIAN